MSQNDTVTDSETTNPDEAQEVSESNDISDLFSDEDKKKQFDDAVAEAVKHQFDVKPLAWGIRKITKFQLELPSGQTVLLKHLDTMDLAKYDLLEELDFFVKRLFPPSYDEHGNPAVADEERTDIWATLKDNKKKLRFFNMTNRLVSVAAMKPMVLNDGVALVKNKNGDDEIIFGHELEDEDRQLELFGTAVSPIDKQVELFGKPIPTISDPESQTYAGVIDFGDRMAIFHALNQPLEMIEPFR